MLTPKVKVLFLVALLLMLAAVTAQAQQTLDQTYNNGTVFFQYPNSFSLDDSGPNPVLKNLTGSLTMTFEPPNALFSDATADRVLSATLRSRGLKFGDITSTDVAYAGGRTISWTTLDDGSTALAVDFTGGGAGVVMVDGILSLQQATVMDIVASYDAASASCKLWTGDAEGARVRVGPGENRGVVTYLPANMTFVPMGQATDDNGEVWYQVDPKQAAPKNLINEAWVRSSQVSSAGDCASVPAAAAPDLVPLPTSTPAS